jgi:mannose/cellobiose epimerase-like protein (N-acyl-D-glucosamine 2-epimerase family)
MHTQIDPIEKIAAEAHDWLFNSALPLWFERGIDWDNWGYSERLSFDGETLDDARRINVQARQVYVFCEAGRLGWTGDWKKAARHGLSAIEKYRRTDGLYSLKLSASGETLGDAPEVYGQAFVLFAWAHATVAFAGDLTFEDKSQDLLATLRQLRGHRTLGFEESSPPTVPLRSNPHMHLFEASQAWMAISQATCWSELANDIAQLARTRFVDGATGWLRELFDGNWHAIPDEFGILAEPGHQFEWAWLFNRYGHSTGNEDYLDLAKSLHRLGISGIDPQRKVPHMSWSVGIGPRPGVARLWPATEWLKSAIVQNDEAEIARAWQGLKLFFQTPVVGLWADKMRPDGTLVSEPAPASTFYHVICAISELLHYAKARTK